MPEAVIGPGLCTVTAETAGPELAATGSRPPGFQGRHDARDVRQAQQVYVVCMYVHMQSCIHVQSSHMWQ